MDYAMLPDVIKLKRKILSEQKENGLTQVLVFQTQYGYHLELIYNREIEPSENFEIRERYGDCKKRLEYSRARYNIVGSNYDILFQIKKKNWRKRAWV